MNKKEDNACVVYTIFFTCDVNSIKIYDLLYHNIHSWSREHKSNFVFSGAILISFQYDWAYHISSVNISY